jgi:hypothetical protein
LLRYCPYNFNTINCNRYTIENFSTDAINYFESLKNASEAKKNAFKT